MKASTAPAVSVVVPTHNRADLISETLKSVLAQTYDDLEIIVVDNGSTDGTEAVVVALGDPRIRYYWQQDSGLPANSRNVAIRTARGRYIAFLDSDDLWLSGKLELQVPWMEAHPDVGFTCTNALGFDGKSRNWRLNKISMVRRQGLEDLLRGNFVATLTVVLRRECLDRVGLFNEDPQLRALEDYELWLRIAAHYPLAYLSNVTARYRMHEGNLADETRVTIERTIAMLRGLKGATGVPEAGLRGGLAAHYRRLARAHAFAGNDEEYIKALTFSWESCPDWKTGSLLVFYNLIGFGMSRWTTTTARQLKATFDQGLWWLRSKAPGVSKGQRAERNC